MPTTADKRMSFRALHERGCFILANAWDAGSAGRLQALGFRALGSSSVAAGWSAGASGGSTDLDLDGALANLRAIVAATDLPVSADFENGYADAPEGVARTVTQALETGIAGLSIEDWPGSALYDQQLAAERIAAARAAIDAVDPAVVLTGRCEHFRAPEMPAATAIARAVAYADAGADCLFTPFLADPGVVRELVAAVAPKPVNVVVHRYDEAITALAALGVRRISVGGSLAGAAWTAFDNAAARLRALEPEAQSSG